MWTSKCSSFKFASEIIAIGLFYSCFVPRIVAASVAVASETKICEFFKADNVCDNSTCEKVENCKSPDSGKYTPCFTLWHTDNKTGEASVLLKGCFTDTIECSKKPACKVHNSKVDLLFCCCDGDMCNQNNTFPGYPPTTEPPPLRINEAPVAESEDLMSVLIYTLIPLTVLFVVLLACYFLYNRRKITLFNELPTAETSISLPPSPTDTYDFGSLPVVLTEVRARGRFGAVWSAKLNHQDVAVKVFPVQDKQSWMSELEIFRLPKMNHSNILQFMGVDKKGENLQSEYWLITAYHEKGSLCDYLKAHTLTWLEACKIAVTMARGLTHLHEESHADLDGGYKPAIAHRDFKSKNVLLKADMSACIADFGLALVFQPAKPCGDTHGQVGTRRYMAPEVLEGAINFTKDAFLRIDMYACGLVLWEIVSRCVEGGCGSDPYRLPLEEEVGSHPSLEEMQDAVVLRKLRPQIQQLWRSHTGLAVLSDTMEECWDHDAEARLSASCVLERIAASNMDHVPLYIEHAQPLLTQKDYSN